MYIKKTNPKLVDLFTWEVSFVNADLLRGDIATFRCARPRVNLLSWSVIAIEKFVPISVLGDIFHVGDLRITFFSEGVMSHL